MNRASAVPLLVGLLAASCSGGGDGTPPVEKATEESPPAVSEARVEGAFGAEGFYGTEFTFSPQCPSGPCDLTATGMRPKILLAQPEGEEFLVIGSSTRGRPLVYASKKPRVPTKIDFVRDSGTYRGTVRFEEDCSIKGFKVPVSITYEFKVAQAKLVEGEWRATELKAVAKLRTEKRTFDEGDAHFLRFAQFRFTCLPVRSKKNGTATLQT